MIVSFWEAGANIATFDIRKVPAIGDKVKVVGRTFKVVDSVQEIFGKNDDHLMHLTIEEV